MQSSNTTQDWRNLLQESGEALNQASADLIEPRSTSNTDALC